MTKFGSLRLEPSLSSTKLGLAQFFYSPDNQQNNHKRQPASNKRIPKETIYREENPARFHLTLMKIGLTTIDTTFSNPTEGKHSKS